MELINEIFGNDIGGIIWEYGRPRTNTEIEVDIENIRSIHMCPECKKAIDNNDPYNPIEPEDYACCWNFCWQDYDEDLAYEYYCESYENLYPKPPNRHIKKIIRKRK